MRVHPLLIALPLYALDQLTKEWVLRRFEEGQGEQIIPGFFDLVYWKNTGAAFSFLSEHNGFFLLLSVVAMVGLLFAYYRGAFHEPLYRWGVGLLMGGILGNLTDRIFLGHVVDFLLFNLHVPFANPWPAFNVADSCICVAVALFVIQGFREGKASAAAE